MPDPKRVEHLRSRLAEEKRLALELVQRFTKPPLRNQATQLARDADEIENIFLGANLDTLRPRAMALMHLKSVERMIDLFLKSRRESLQSILDKYGEDATLVG